MAVCSVRNSLFKVFTGFTSESDPYCISLQGMGKVFLGAINLFKIKNEIHAYNDLNTHLQV